MLIVEFFPHLECHLNCLSQVIIIPKNTLLNPLRHMKVNGDDNKLTNYLFIEIKITSTHSLQKPVFVRGTY